jgi:4-aminobutyrate aminotransferase
MLGIELVRLGKVPDPETAARLLEACRERGLLVGKGGLKANSIRISPPLIVTREAADEAADILEESLVAVEAKERVS